MAYAIPRRVRLPLAAALAVALGWPVPAVAMRAGTGAAEPGSPDAARTDATAEPSAPRVEVQKPKSPEAPGAGTTVEPSSPRAEGKKPASPDAPEAGATGPEGELPRPYPDADPATLTPEELAERQLQAKIEQATEHYKEGQRLYTNGRYAEAAVEFERSYAAVAAANTLYAVSLAYGRAGKTVEAVRALERYLELPDCDQWAPEERPIDCTTQRSDAERDLAEQRRRVGELALSNPEGVELREVRVAGRTVPLDDFPLLMLPGTVDVELFGMGPKDRRTRPAFITAGEVYEVYVASWVEEIVEPPEKPDPLGDRLRAEQRQERLRISFWVGVGLTAASGVALGVMGGMTRYHYRRFELEVCAANCHERDEDGDLVLDGNGNPIPLDIGYPLNHLRLFNRYKPITNTLVGVTIGLAVGTALLGAFALPRKQGEPSEQARAHIRVGAPGLVVRW